MLRLEASDIRSPTYCCHGNTYYRIGEVRHISSRAGKSHVASADTFI